MTAAYKHRHLSMGPQLAEPPGVLSETREIPLAGHPIPQELHRCPRGSSVAALAGEGDRATAPAVHSGWDAAAIRRPSRTAALWGQVWTWRKDTSERAGADGQHPDHRAGGECPGDGQRRAYGRGAAMVPRAAGRPAGLGDAGGAGRCAVLCGVDAAGRRPRPARAIGRDLRRRPADAGPVDQPAADRAAHLGHDRRGRGAGATAGRGRRGAERDRRDAAVLSGGGVQRGPGVRAGGRVARHLGRPAAGAAGRRAAAGGRRRTSWPAGPPRWAGTTAPRSRWRSGARPAARRPWCCTRCTGWPGGWGSRCSAGCTAVASCSSSAARTTRWRRRRSCSAAFGEGPVVVGPGVPTLDDATESARAASGRVPVSPGLADRARARWPRPTCCRSARWPGMPRPDGSCGRRCSPALGRAGGELLETLDAFFAAGGVLESAARALFVHPNTVRYRLRRVGEITGLSPLASRDAFALRIALTVGRLDPSAARTTPRAASLTWENAGRPGAPPRP